MREGAKHGVVHECGGVGEALEDCGSKRKVVGRWGKGRAGEKASGCEEIGSETGDDGMGMDLFEL